MFEYNWKFSIFNVSIKIFSNMLVAMKVEEQFLKIKLFNFIDPNFFQRYWRMEFEVSSYQSPLQWHYLEWKQSKESWIKFNNNKASKDRGEIHGLKATLRKLKFVMP